MSSIWYTGLLAEKIITSERWAAIGFTHDDSVWNADNGWSLPASDFTPPEIAILMRLGDFVYAPVDGPRPSANTPLNPPDPSSNDSLLFTGTWSSLYASHSFPYYPNVLLIDSDGHSVETDVEYPDESHVSLVFPTPFTGVVVIG